jgi:hypothetical protein
MLGDGLGTRGGAGNGMVLLSREPRVTGHADQGMRRPSLGSVQVPSSGVTVQDLKLGPLDQL